MFHWLDFGKLLFSKILTKIPYNIALIWFLLQFVVGSAPFRPRLTGLILQGVKWVLTLIEKVYVEVYQNPGKARWGKKKHNKVHDNTMQHPL